MARDTEDGSLGSERDEQEEIVAAFLKRAIREIQECVDRLATTRVMAAADKDEIVSATALCLMTQIRNGRIDPRSPGLPRGWVSRTVRFTWRNLVRRHDRERRTLRAEESRYRSSPERLDDLPSSALTPAELVFRRERCDDILALVATLPGSQGEVFRLVVLEGRSIDQVSSITGLKATTVHRTLTRARRCLRRALGARNR